MNSHYLHAADICDSILNAVDATLANAHRFSRSTSEEIRHFSMLHDTLCAFSNFNIITSEIA